MTNSFHHPVNGNDSIAPLTSLSGRPLDSLLEQSAAAQVSQDGLQLWGGVECTINRVGCRYQDQFRLCGHTSRPDDIDIIATLGMRALRYPVLWEAHFENNRAWDWSERQLRRLLDHRIEPVVGLVHHGSGPEYTSLVCPQFAGGLARHAREVAERFPWITHFNPVNEPLTTARFSCLYGHWYPHLRSRISFARALLNQLTAVKLAMREIRKVTPGALLVQTEDMGKTYSTELLDYQAEFENERRWLSLDLLCGRVNRDHAVWSYLQSIGISFDELQPFIDDPCPPDIIGINHYVTSERFLDERIEHYPESRVGGNGRHTYADVSAVRVCETGIHGPHGILKDTSSRYQQPIAITEAHLGCTREEQLRWIMEVWSAAQRSREEGADIRAVTVWSLLGAYEWNSLMTRTEGHYEAGAFDVRGGKLRPTAIASCMKALSATGEFYDPVLSAPGWWRRPSRLIYPPAIPHGAPHVANGSLQSGGHLNGQAKPDQRPLLITGATGTLGQAFRRMCEMRALNYHLVGRHEMDIADRNSVEAMLAQSNAWAVVNTAGYVRVDDAEDDAPRCFRENTDGPACLAAACAKRKLPLLNFSSDLVFDGAARRPYLESDAAHPLNVYGRSKAEMEKQVMRIWRGALVVRTSAFFGPWDEYNFVTCTLRSLEDGDPVGADDDKISPTYLPDLVNACLDLLIDGATGICHLANEGMTSWVDFARRLAANVGVDPSLVYVNPNRKRAVRPDFSVLGSERGMQLASLEDALGRYALDRQAFLSQNVQSIPFHQNTQ